MNEYNLPTKKSQRLRLLVGALLFLLLLVGGGVLAVRQVYQNNLEQVSSSEEIVLVEIPTGSTPHEIAVLLEEKGVIKNAWAFEWYIRNEGVRDQLKAGTYALRPSLGVASVVGVITQGTVATDSITIFPAQRLDQIEEHFINEGFSPEDVAKALDPDTYKGHPALVDKPTGTNLEGYIYPETFQKTSETTATQIVSSSLNELNKQLTPKVRAEINKQGLTVHEAIVLASVIENEVTSKEDRQKAAQVFLKRLRQDIALESDVTAKYGAVLDEVEPSIFH